MAFEGHGFELAYRAYAQRLRAVAYHVLGDRAAAEDAVHGALMRAWSSGAYRPERGPLYPYLVACVRREALDLVRGARRRSDRERKTAGDAVIPDPTAALDPIEARRVRSALDVLPQPQRDVIVRAYYANRTLTEIAAELGIPVGTVKSRLAAALRRLAAELSGGTVH
ncbi:MAG TPA: RNA polymerase sigma factor [Candidatus Elarobacter sp.]